MISLSCATLEPHLPHVLIENGDMTQEEYDEYLHGRSDFIKATKKDSSNERKVSVSSTSAACFLANENSNIQYHCEGRGTPHSIMNNGLQQTHCSLSQ